MRIMSRLFGFNVTAHVRRAEAKLNLGPPFGRAPFHAPSVREAFKDLDGMDARARQRAAIIRARKTMGAV